MVRPFVGGNKNDAHDARAIWTAVQQPGVKTVAIKSEEQQAILALHRMRQQLVKFRNILVSGEASIDRLAKQTDDAMPAVLARPAVGQDIARQCGQPQGIVEFTIGEPSGVGGDPRAVELKLQSAVETGPKWAAIRFTLRVPHPNRPLRHLTL